MVTYKVLLDARRPKSDGSYAVTIRITHDRKSTTFNTGVFVKKEQWLLEKCSVSNVHPNAGLLNKTVTETYLRVQKSVLELESEGEFSFENLKERLTTQPTKERNVKSLSFKTFAEHLINDMLAVNQAGNAIVYRTAMNRMLSFTNNDKLKFNEIDYKLLDGFRRGLLKDDVKQNTISNYFRTLRAIYNKAIKAKLVDRAKYPFLDITIKAERTAKRAITIDELKKFSAIELACKSREWYARSYFLLSFALVGASFTDLAYLTSANVVKGRIIYKRRKTGKELSIKLQPISEAVLRYCKGYNEKYLLPILPANIAEDSMKAKAIISQWIKTTNKWLSRIVLDYKLECEITTYVARHSWATTAKRLGYSVELIAEALGHEYGNRITNIYLDSFDQDLLDTANANILVTATDIGTILSHELKTDIVL